MAIIQRVVKPKTQRGKRFLASREPQINENGKTAIFIRGAKASSTVLDCMKDLNTLKKPNAVYFGKKNEILPFEDPSKIEFFSQKNDASLFMFGSNNKKRPNNLIIGRMFNHHLLDMYELGIEHYKGLKEFKVPKILLGTKPCLVFLGDSFEQTHELRRLKNLFLDFFRGQQVESVRLAGLEHVITFALVENKISFRSHRIIMVKSGKTNPRIELEEIGPSIDFSIRRMKLASDDLFKHACKQPKQLKPKKVKNIKKDVFGTKLGRIHMQKQDLSKLQTRKMKGLRKQTNAKQTKRKNDDPQDGMTKKIKVVD